MYDRSTNAQNFEPAAFSLYEVHQSTFVAAPRGQVHLRSVSTAATIRMTCVHTDSHDTPNSRNGREDSHEDIYFRPKPSTLTPSKP